MKTGTSSRPSTKTIRTVNPSGYNRERVLRFEGSREANMSNYHDTTRYQDGANFIRAHKAIRGRNRFEIVRLQLPMVNRLDIERVADHVSIPFVPGPERDQALLAAARSAAEYLPADFFYILGDLVTRGTNTHAVLIDNLPVDQVVTDSDGRCKKPGHKSDVSLLAIIYAAGVHVFQYLQESDAGQLIKAITPDPKDLLYPSTAVACPWVCTQITLS